MPWRPTSARSGGDVYSATLAAGEAAGTVAGPLLPLAFGVSIFLVPMLDLLQPVAELGLDAVR